MADIDIDALLADETEEQKDLKTEETTAENKSTQETAEEKESKREKILKRELRKRQEEIELLKAEKETKVETKEEALNQELAIDENDPGAKLWLEKINQTTKEAIKPILEANQKRAVKAFLDRHPEYATPEYKTKLQEIVKSAQGVEEGELLTSMSKAWAAQNYEELERIQAKREAGRQGAQKAAIHASSTGEGIRREDDFSEEEERKAARLGMSPEEYRKARAQYRSNLVNTL